MALHYASQGGHVEIVTLVLSSGSYVDVADTEGCSPVMLAAAHDRVAAVRLLHRHGASLKLVDANGRSVLHYAALHKTSATAVDYFLPIVKNVPECTTSQESLCAAEYAYILGYKEVGAFLAARTGQDVAVKTPAKSVKLLEPDDEFTYISIVDVCEGDADVCEDMCEAIEGDGHAIDARIQAEVVRENSEDVKWTAVEYAAHLGHLVIAKHLVKETKDLPIKTKIQLIKHAQDRQAKKAATVA